MCEFDIKELQPPGEFGVRQASKEGEERENLLRSLIAHPYKVYFAFLWKKKILYGIFDENSYLEKRGFQDSSSHQKSRIISFLPITFDISSLCRNELVWWSSLGSSSLIYVTQTTLLLRRRGLLWLVATTGMCVSIFTHLFLGSRYVAKSSRRRCIRNLTCSRNFTWASIVSPSQRMLHRSCFYCFLQCLGCSHIIAGLSGKWTQSCLHQDAAMGAASCGAEDITAPARNGCQRRQSWDSSGSCSRVNHEWERSSVRLSQALVSFGFFHSL